MLIKYEQLKQREFEEQNKQQLYEFKSQTSFEVFINYLNRMLQAGLHFTSQNRSQLSIFNTKKVLSHILLLCTLFSISLTQASISVNPVSKTINANTIYEFTIADSLIRDITNTQAVIEISFPPSLFSFNTAATYTCYNTDTPSTTYSCRATTTNVIQIDKPSITTRVFKVSVSVVKNPSSTEQVTFGYVFRHTNSNTIISQNTTEVFRNYVPGSLISCSASFNPNTVHTTSEITITIMLGNQVQANGSIYVNFPSVWSDSASSAFPPIISTATQGCTRRSTDNYLSTTLSCTTVDQQVLLTKSINSTAPNGSSLSFSISNILSPPTVSNGNSIVVTTLTENYSEIDKTTCVVSPVTVRAIAGVTAVSQLAVGTTTEFQFDFLAPTPITTGDKLIISAVSPNDAFFSLSAPGTVYITFFALSLTVDSANSASISLNFPIMSNVIPASQRISVIQGFFVKPLISSGTKSLTLTLKRGSNDYASQSFAITILTNVLLNPSITLSTPTVSSVANYTFIVTTSNILGVRSRIIIRLPAQISIPNGACLHSVVALSNPSSINASSNCNAASNQIITLTGVNSNALPAGQRLTITIQNILNSQTTAPSNIFRIQTYFGETITDPTDLSSTMTVTMTAAMIGVVSVSSLVPRVAEITTYTISYTVRTKFLANSKIRIGIPSEVSLGANLATSFSITFTNTTTTTFQSCPVFPLSINSVQYLDLTSISTSVLPANTVINIRIVSLVNPNSLRPSSSFRIIQIDSRGFEVEKQQAGLTVTNTLTNSFPVLYASQDPVRTNGQTVIYTLQLKTSIDLATNDFIEIILDSTTNKNAQISFSNPITSCDVYSVLNNVKTRLTTTFQKPFPNVLRVNLGQSMPSSLDYIIAINTIERARTQEIPNNLTLKSFKYVSASISYGISEGKISPRETNRKSTIQSVSLNILTNPSQLFSFQSFAITVVPKIPLISGDYLIIQIPNLYSYWGSIVTVTPTTNLLTVASQSLCIQSAYYCSHFSSDPYKIRVQEFSTVFSNLSSVTVTIKNNLYRSPSTFAFVGAGYYFKATTYASNNLIIDETVVTGTPSTNLNNAEFYLTCNTNIATYHCMTCASSGLCTSCYQTTTVNSIQYTFDGFKFLTSDSRCLSFCGIGYFIDSGTNLCVRCDSPCNTCEITSTTCLSCIQNITTNKYFSGNKTCLSTCPDGFYPDPGNTCIRCSTSCNTCVTDALTCTSCSSGTFLNSVTKTCVSSTSCPTGTFANSLTNTCATCHISCSGCVTQSTNCLTCATGYIVDFSNTTFKNCTNLCPPGKVNDTVNGLGCRCQTQCKTCQGTISTCKSCDTTSIYKYFYGTTCLITCPQGTYASVIQATGNDICITCSEANCRTCDAGNCYQCVGQYALYQGRCFSACPTASVLTVVSGVRKCQACSVGCMNCDLGVTTCTTCQSGFVRQANATGTYCTTTCSAGTVNFNNTICLSSCPDGYDNIAQVCRLKQNNTTNPVVQSSGLSKTRQIPFPFIIAAFILLVIVLLSKIVLPTSIVSTLFTTIVGALQPFSWIAAVAVAIFEISQGKHWPTSAIGVYLILAALGTNFVLNIIAIVFYSKYIAKDSKFTLMYGYNQKKVYLGKCPTISILVISFIISHKILQILFSNFLSSRHFSYKLQNVQKMVPLNYLLFCSIIPSLLAIVGGCIISYELQNYNVQSSAFIAALDMILLTVMGIIASLWVTNRKSEDYEKDITGTTNEKHYTEEIFVEGHVQEATQQFDKVFMEQSGIRRLGNQAKSYYYQASRVQKGQHTHDNDPLSKRQTVRNPISKSNQKKIRTSNLSDQQSSQALVINEKNKRRNLKDEFSSDDDQNNVNQDGMEVIDLEKTKQNFNKNDDSKEMPLISKIKYPNKDPKQKPEELLNMSSEQKKLLKQKIESQLNPEEKQKLSVLSKQKELKIKKKKQKIEQILKLQNAEKQKLAADQRAKVEKVQQAVDLLKRKQIKIEEYLLYSQIIKEQSGEYNNDSEEQISEIDQKTNTIIKGILEDDQQLEEVINLSPKRKILQSQSGVFKSKSKEKEKETTPPKREGQLQRSKSRESNSLPKSIEKKQTSKEKTIKKEPITTNKKPTKNQKKNKTKPPNDLQVNYNGENEKAERSPDSQQEPELPKNRSNIIANNDKSRNRSQKKLNPKKNIFNRGEIMMIDVGSNRQNRTQNEISQFGGMEEQHSDMMPPNYLRSTEKVEYKKNHPFDGLRNPYDSQLDRETLKSVENADMDFFNEISPSKFEVQNRQFDHVQTEDLPVKPKIIQEINYDQDTPMQRKGKSPRKNDGFEIYQGQELDDQQNYISKVNINKTMNRSSSDMRDFKQVILRKTMQNEKLKQLEKIYMPKPDKKLKTKRDKSVSRISSRKD